MVLVLGIVKASSEILGIGIGVKKVVLLMSAVYGISVQFLQRSGAVNNSPLLLFFLGINHLTLLARKSNECKLKH